MGNNCAVGPEARLLAEEMAAAVFWNYFLGHQRNGRLNPRSSVLGGEMQWVFRPHY
jgi:hypothetical protein